MRHIGTFYLCQSLVNGLYQFISNTEQKHSKTRENLEKLEIRLKVNTWYKILKMQQRGCQSLLRDDLYRSCKKETKENMGMRTLYQSFSPKLGKILARERSMWGISRWQLCLGEPLSLTLLNWFCPKWCDTRSTRKFRLGRNLLSVQVCSKSGLDPGLIQEACVQGGHW